MRRGDLRRALGPLALALALTGAPPVAAKAPRTKAVRVEVVSRSQGAVARRDRIRVRVSSSRRGLVRLGGRVVTMPGGKRRASCA